MVEEVARDTEMLGRVGGKLPGVEGIGLVGRGMLEPSCSGRSTGDVVQLKVGFLP